MRESPFHLKMVRVYLRGVRKVPHPPGGPVLRRVAADGALEEAGAGVRPRVLAQLLGVEVGLAPGPGGRTGRGLRQQRRRG